VLVVGEGAHGCDITYSGDAPDGPGLVRGVVFEPLRSMLGGPGHEMRFRLCLGRSLTDAPGGPFSFVPFAALTELIRELIVEGIVEGLLRRARGQRDGLTGLQGPLAAAGSHVRT
jgi:hypothetical protein